VSALGIHVDRRDTDVEIHGQGPMGFKPPADVLDAGNSGSTIRMLSGILAAQPFRTTIFGEGVLITRAEWTPLDYFWLGLTTSAGFALSGWGLTFFRKLGRTFAEL
jgi:hypothetical protein